MRSLIRFSPASCVAAVLAASMATPGVASAAVILNASAARTADRPAGSATGDGADTGTSRTVTPSSSLLVGDSSNNRDEFRANLEFDISGVIAEINDALSITFSIEVAAIVGDLGSFDFLALSAGEDGSFASSGVDYGTAGVVLQTFDASTLSAGDVLTIDVTSVVQGDAGQTYTGFRFQASDEDVFNDEDGGADIVNLGVIGSSGSNSATLTIVPIPEPASAVLAGAGMFLLMTRRRESA